MEEENKSKRQQQLQYYKNGKTKQEKKTKHRGMFNGFLKVILPLSRVREQFTSQDTTVEKKDFAPKCIFQRTKPVTEPTTNYKGKTISERKKEKRES